VCTGAEIIVGDAESAASLAPGVPGSDIQGLDEGATPGAVPTPTGAVEPSQTTPTPEAGIGLRLVNADVAREISEDAVVTEGNVRRLKGQLALKVSSRMDASLLLETEPAIELLFESKLTDRRGFHLIIVRVPEENLESNLLAFQALPGVDRVGKHTLLELAAVPNDPGWSSQLDRGLRLMNLPRAWDVTRGRPSVRVAVIDSGVNPQPDMFTQLDPGYNVIANSTNTADDISGYGHGTRVASIIAATSNNGSGIAGIASNVRIVPVKACYPSPFNSEVPECTGPLVEEALIWVQNQPNIDVVNMSLGGPSDQGAYIDDEIEFLDHNGVIVVASSGNAGDDDVYWPARVEKVVAVGGTYPDGSRHPYSNYGSDLDVAAPILAWALTKFGFPAEFCCTSASAPMIAGLAALFKSETIVELSSPREFVGALAYGGSEWNQYTGRGVPDAFQVLRDNGCFRTDFNNDREVGVVDQQIIASRYGQYIFSPLYNIRFDIEPKFPDYDIDIKDLQWTFGRDGMHCPT
jgi:subtilisin family serine protease